MTAYIHNLLVSLDQLCNAVLGGWPDETMSSRFWRWHVDGVRSWPCRCLDNVAAWLGDKDHCRTSYESERTRRQLPPELRAPL